MHFFYNATFKRFEPKKEEKDADDWFIEPVEEEAEASAEEVIVSAEEVVAGTETMEEEA